MGGTVTLNNVVYKPEIVLPGREGSARESSGRGAIPCTEADLRCRDKGARPPHRQDPEPAPLCWSQGRGRPTPTALSWGPRWGLGLPG